jgi:lysophospholipase
LPEFCRFYGIDFDRREPYPSHHCGTVRSGRYDLAVHLWRRPGATSNLLLLHGYFDHTGLFGKLVEYGLSRNCNVLIFDLPGHGLSSGEPASINDFREYSQAIHHVLSAVSLPERPLWVMGQSTGCAALVDFAGNHPWPFRSTVLLAPLVRPVGWFRVRLAHMLLRHFADSIPRKFNENSSDRAFLEFVQSDPVQSGRLPLSWVAALKRWLRTLPAADLAAGPALVVQGDVDTTVAWRYNIRVVKALFPGSKVAYLPGAGHQLANESETIRLVYFDVIDKYLVEQALPVEPPLLSEQHPAADSALDGGELGQGDVAVLRVDVDNHVTN